MANGLGVEENQKQSMRLPEQNVTELFCVRVTGATRMDVKAVVREARTK